MRTRRTKAEIEKLRAVAENILQAGGGIQEAATASGLTPKDIRRWIGSGRIRTSGTLDVKVDVKNLTSNSDQVPTKSTGPGAPDPTPGPSPSKAADPEGLRAALGAAGAGGEDFDQAESGGAGGEAFPDVRPIPDAERRDKKREEQEAFVIESAEAIKETMLEVLGMKYSPPLDLDSAKVRKLAKVSAMTRKSIQKNAGRLAPSMEALLASPFALFALVAVETVAMAAMLKKEAVKAGWKPEPKPNQGDQANQTQHQGNGAAPPPGQPGAAARRPARGEPLPANMIDPFKLNPRMS